MILNPSMRDAERGGSGTASEWLLPQDIADAIVSPTSYADEDVIYPALAWARQNNPLGVARVEGYDPIWIATKFKDLLEIERQPDIYVSGDLNPILNKQADDAFMRSINNGSIRLLHSLTFMDPPEHTRIRSVTAPWFLPSNIGKLEARIRPIARETVAHMLSLDGECDFAKDVALYYPLRVIMGLLGVPPEDELYMLKLTQEFLGGEDPEEQREEVKLSADARGRMWHAALQDFFGYFNKKSAERRADPQEDLLTVIATAKLDGELLPQEVCNGYYVALASAGHDTTSSTTSAGLLGMMRFPDEFTKLKNDPSITRSFVEEAVRYSAPVKHFMRTASADTELRGRKIRAKDRFFLSYPSACRDEEIFNDPDRFIADRAPNRHMGFGSGPHMCLGAHLGKLEMRILFEELMPRLQSAELAGTPCYMRTNFVSGLKSLPIRFKAA